MLLVVAILSAVIPPLLFGCAGPSKNVSDSKRDSNRVLASSAPTATPATSTKKKASLTSSKGQSKKSAKEHPNSSKTLQTGSKITSVSRKTESISKKVKPAPLKDEEAENGSQKKKQEQGIPATAQLRPDKTQDSEDDCEKEATSRDPTKEDTKSLVFDKNQPISEDHDHGI